MWVESGINCLREDATLCCYWCTLWLQISMAKRAYMYLNFFQ
jgi:hypothetical protein